MRQPAQAADLDRGEWLCGFHLESWGIFYLLEAFGHLALAEGEPERAARLWGAAERLGESIRTVLALAEQSEHERSLAAARWAGRGGLCSRTGRWSDDDIGRSHRLCPGEVPVERPHRCSISPSGSYRLARHTSLPQAGEGKGERG